MSLYLQDYLRLLRCLIREGKLPRGGRVSLTFGSQAPALGSALRTTMLEEQRSEAREGAVILSGRRVLQKIQDLPHAVTA